MEIITLKMNVGVLRRVYDEATVSNNVCLVAILQQTEKGLRVKSGASVIGHQMCSYLLEYLPDVVADGLGNDKLLVTLEDESYQEMLGKILKELDGEVTLVIKSERAEETVKGKKKTFLQGISMLVHVSDDEQYNIPLTAETDKGRHFAVALNEKAQRTVGGVDGKPVVLEPVATLETSVEGIKKSLKKYETMQKFKADYVLSVKGDKAMLVTGNPEIPNEVFARLPLVAAVKRVPKDGVTIPLVPMLGNVVPSIVENDITLEVYREGEREYVSLKSVVRGDDDKAINKVRIVDIAAKDILRGAIGDEGDDAEPEEEEEEEPEEADEPEEAEDLVEGEEGDDDENAGEGEDEESVI